MVKKECHLHNLFIHNKLIKIVNMKLLTIIYFLTIMCTALKCERIQRLILPTTASVLKIIPNVEMPMVSSNSIQSGFNFKMPISIKFPSVMEVVQSVRQTLNTGNRQAENNEVLSLNKTRVNSRATLYKAIEKTHKSYGRVCLMRAICEVAEVPLISASTGLFGEIFDMLLSSSVLRDGSGLLSVYREAENIGKRGMKKGDKCKTHYKECPLSLFNIAEIPFIG